MSCVLVNPPEVVFDDIPLAIGAIAGALREDRVPVHLDDMNHRFSESMFSRKEFLSSNASLTQELKQLLNRNDAAEGYKERILQLRETIFKGDIFYSKIAWAKHVLKNWNEKFDYNDYRLAEQIRSCVTETVLLKHRDYIEWSGSEGGIGTLSDLCENVNALPNEVLSFLESSISSYDCFWKEHDGPSVLGIAVRSSSQLLWGCTLAKLVRQRHPQVKIVMGGSFISFYMAYYGYQLQRFMPLFEFFDAIVIHDGETAIRELHLKFQNGDHSLTCKNTLSVIDGNVSFKGPIHVERLEELPLPYFGQLKLDQYSTPFPIIPYAPTRGCPFQCSYCSYNLNHCRRYRQEDPCSVVRKILALKEKYGTPYFNWSVSVLPAAYAKNLGKELIKKKAEIRWYCQTRVDKAFTRSVCDTLHLSGARHLELGVETASNHILRKMRKGVTKKDIQSVIDNLFTVGISIGVFIIANYPGETLKDFKSTIEFLESNRDVIASIEIQQFFLSAGSHMWENPGEYGINYKVPNNAHDIVFLKDHNVPYEGGVSQRIRRQKEELIQMFKLQSSYYCCRFDESKGWYSFKRYGMMYYGGDQFLFTSLGLSGGGQKSILNRFARWQLVEKGWKILPEDVRVMKEDESEGEMVVSAITGESMMLEKTELSLFLALEQPMSIRDLAIKAENIYQISWQELEPEIDDVVRYWHRLGFLREAKPI